MKKTKSKGKTSGRQTKLPVSGNSLKHTKPSPFAESIDPTVPEFNANPKKASTTRLKNKKAKEEGPKVNGEGEEEETLKKGLKGAKKVKGSATAKAIKESFNISDEDSDMMDSDVEEMDLASRLAVNRPSRAKAKPASYAEVEEEEEEEEEEEGKGGGVQRSN